MRLSRSYSMKLIVYPIKTYPKKKGHMSYIKYWELDLLLMWAFKFFPPSACRRLRGSRFNCLPSFSFGCWGVCVQAGEWGYTRAVSVSGTSRIFGLKKNTKLKDFFDQSSSHATVFHLCASMMSDVISCVSIFSHFCLTVVLSYMITMKIITSKSSDM